MCLRTKPLNHSRKDARLVGDLIQFAGRRLLDQRVQRLRRNKVGLSQPSDEAVAAVEPVDWLIDRRRDRVEEVEAKRIGDEKRRRSRRHNSP